jgi:hypothetical protein
LYGSPSASGSSWGLSTCQHCLEPVSPKHLQFSSRFFLYPSFLFALNSRLILTASCPTIPACLIGSFLPLTPDVAAAAFNSFSFNSPSSPPNSILVPASSFPFFKSASSFRPCLISSSSASVRSLVTSSPTPLNLLGPRLASSLTNGFRYGTGGLGANSFRRFGGKRAVMVGGRGRDGLHWVCTGETDVWYRGKVE